MYHCSAMGDGAPKSEGVFDWTLSPAKWGAVGLLAMLGAGGLAWSAIRGQARVVYAGVEAGDQTSRSAAPSSAVPVTVSGAGRWEPSAGDTVVPVTLDPADDPPAGLASDAVAFGPTYPGDLEPSAGEGAAEALRALARPAVAPGTPAVAPATSTTAHPPKLVPGVGQRIDVNHASEAELQVLPGIGPARARAIIDDRRLHGPFRSVDDLERVRGIGPALLEGLRAFATAG